MAATWPRTGIADLEERGILQLGRGKVISKKDLAASPGAYPVYSSAKENDGKFGEYGEYMFDEELITWSVDGGGRLFHRPKHRFSITNVGGFVRILDTEEVDCRYLYFVLTYLHSQVRFDWVRKAHPSVIRKVYTDFPMPSLDEQKRIVAVLDQAFAALDRARANVEANMADAEELFDTLVQAAIDELENRHGTRALEHHVEFKNGFAFKSAKFTSDGEPVARISNIQDGRIDLTKVVFTRRDDYTEDLSKYEIHPDELLIAMSGATTGKIGFNRTGRVLLQNQRVGRFTKKSKMNLEYLAYFLETKVEEHLSISAGAAQPNLSTKQIREIVLPIPDDQGQIDFVMRMEKMREKIQAAKASYTAQLSDLDDLRQSLLQKAFVGELA